MPGSTPAMVQAVLIVVLQDQYSVVDPLFDTRKGVTSIGADLILCHDELMRRNAQRPLLRDLSPPDDETYPVRKEREHEHDERAAKWRSDR